MIFGMLRVKNEARWIGPVVNAILPICREVFILDDHSTDDTRKICHDAGCRVFESPFDDLHEARDKDYLLAKVWQHGGEVGDYCLMLDGDEQLLNIDAPLVEQYAYDGRLLCGTVNVLYLWDKLDQIRVDRWYSDVRRPSLFKLIHKDLTFKRTQFGGNLHCSSAPVELIDRTEDTAIRVLHYGYLLREDRVRKYHWYNSIDPNNHFEDCYRHMVIGDLFPATSRFKWAGPLQLQAIT